MAWSLLEATLQSLDEEMDGRPRTPGTVIQTLAMKGRISPETEERARALIRLRNSIVHGDVSVEPAAADVDLLLGIVEGILDIGEV